MANKHKNKTIPALTTEGIEWAKGIEWKVGITPACEVFLYFSNGERHFECTMDGDTPKQMGNALIDMSKKRKALINAAVQDVVDPVIPRLIPLTKKIQ